VLPGLPALAWQASKPESPSSFVIDSEGVVAKVLHKVEPAEHDERVLAALAHIV
jgi:peroxiredoxin